MSGQATCDVQCRMQATGREDRVLFFQSLDCYMTRSHTPSLVDVAPCFEGGFFGGRSSVF